MLDAVFEENKVHGLVIEVVEFQLLVQSRDQVCRSAEFHIQLLRVLKVSKKDVLICCKVKVHGAASLHLLMSQLREELPVLANDETVTEDAESLAHKQFHKVLLVLNLVVVAHKHALHDFAHVSEVESVMTLQRRREELLLSELVDLD